MTHRFLGCSSQTDNIRQGGSSIEFRRSADKRRLRGRSLQAGSTTCKQYDGVATVLGQVAVC